MVQLGAAFAYRKYLKQCDLDAYLTAETAAMNSKLGVWGLYKVNLKPGTTAVRRQASADMA